MFSSQIGVLQRSGKIKNQIKSDDASFSGVEECHFSVVAGASLRIPDGTSTFAECFALVGATKVLASLAEDSVLNFTDCGLVDREL